MAKQPLVNGYTARQLAVVMEHCVKHDACNTCPYDKKTERGKSCMDFLILDGSLALRRLQKRYETQKYRYIHKIESLQEEIMKQPLYIAWFVDPDYREVRTLGAFATLEEAEAYVEDRKVDAKKAGIFPNIIFGISRTTDRRPE